MDRTLAANYITNAGKRQYQDLNLALNQQGTALIAADRTATQEELVGGLIEGTGQVANAAVLDQGLLGVKRLAGGNTTTVSTAGTTALTADNAGVVLVSAAAGNVVLDLPAVAAATPAGSMNPVPLRFLFVRTDATANTVTLAAAGTDTFLNASYAAASAPAVALGTPVELTGDGAGHWLIGSTAQPMTIQGGYTGLVGQVTGNAAGTWAASAITVSNAAGQTVQLRGVAVAYATGTIGAGGYDGNGALGVSQWLAFFIIYNPTTAAIAALCSHSATAPTLPAGYTFFRYVGSVWLDASGNLMRVIQRGPHAQNQVTAGTNTAALPIMASGVQGSPTAPTWVAVSLASYVPPSATKIDVVIAMGAVSNAAGMAAPNAAYGAYESTTNPPPLVNAIGTSGGASVIEGALVIEGASIYVASNSTIAFAVRGWEDNI